MSNITISLLFAAGFGTWVFTKMNRYNGGSSKNAAIMGATAAIFGFIVLLTILGLIF